MLPRLIISEYGLIHPAELSDSPLWHLCLADRTLGVFASRADAEGERHWLARGVYDGHRLYVVRSHWEISGEPLAGVLAHPIRRRPDQPTLAELDELAPRLRTEEQISQDEGRLR